MAAAVADPVLATMTTTTTPTAATTAPSFTIPTIDIAPYLRDPTSSAAAEVIDAVRRACTTAGFFSLVGHGVPPELQRRVLAASERLFALPLEEKRALRAPGEVLSRGYEVVGAQTLQEGAMPDLKEGFYIGQHIPAEDPRARAHPHFLGPNVFPARVPAEQLREPVEAYYAEMLGLARVVMDILARGLPYGDDVFDEFMSGDPVCTLRLLRYPPPAEEARGKQLGAGAHTDFGAITLLLQDASSGLEVLDASTGAWVPVAPDPAAYVVNVGDMLAAWTRGAYRSNTHRVVHRGARDRYSVPFFVDGNCDVVLAPLDGPRGGDKGAAVGRHKTVEEHLLERFGTTYRAKDA